MESLSEASVLSLAVELEAEVEKIVRDLVIDVKELGVLSECVHDDLCDTCVEVDPWDQPLLVNDLLKVTISQQDQLFRSRFDLLCSCGLLGLVYSLWA